MVSTFFTNAKLGNICGMVIYLGFYILTFIIGGDNNYDIETKTAFALIPQVGITQGMDVFTLIENKKSGIGFGDLGL